MNILDVLQLAVDYVRLTHLQRYPPPTVFTLVLRQGILGILNPISVSQICHLYTLAI